MILAKGSQVFYNSGWFWRRYGISFAVIAVFIVTARKKRFGKRLFAFLQGRLGERMDLRYLTPYKDYLFEPLKTLTSHNGELKAKNSIRILEIGIGSGYNLRYYPEGTNLITVEPNPFFKDYFEKNRERFSHVNVEHCYAGFAEDMSQVEDGTVDVVVSTQVLCSVEDCTAVLKEVHRVLAPGGRFLYLEHVIYPKGSWGRLLQVALGPLWGFWFDGCRITQDTLSFLRQSGFSSLEVKEGAIVAFPYPARPHIWGTAVK